MGVKALAIWNLISAIYALIQCIELLRWLDSWGGDLVWFYILNFIRLVPFYMAAWLFFKYLTMDTKANRERLPIAFFLLICSSCFSIALFLVYPGTFLPFNWGVGWSSFTNLLCVILNFVIWNFFHLYWMQVAKRFAG